MNDEQFRFHGWMKVGMKGEWKLVCSGISKPATLDMLERLRHKKYWSTSVCLKTGETPLCSVRLSEEQ